MSQSCEVCMDLECAAAVLKELGHPTRLKVYRRLVIAGKKGLMVGDLQKELDIPASTLSHHIAALVAVHLVQQRREGRILFCTAQYETLQTLLTFLTNQCCAEQENHEGHQSISTLLTKSTGGKAF